MSLDLSIIIPAYHEALRIGPTLEAITSYCEQAGLAHEIIVVLDGCTDNTAQVLSYHQTQLPLAVIERKENRGKGYSVREGMLAAKGPVRLVMDADSSTNIEHFDLMRPHFDAGADVVCCSRHTKDAPGAEYLAKQAFPKPLLGQLGNLFIQSQVLPGIWDSQCGFKAFTAETAEQIFRHCKIDGWAWDVEVLALAQKLQLNLQWVPARWKNDAASSVRLIHYLDVFKEVRSIRKRMKQADVTGAIRSNAND